MGTLERSTKQDTIECLTPLYKVKRLSKGEELGNKYHSRGRSKAKGIIKMRKNFEIK